MNALMMTDSVVCRRVKVSPVSELALTFVTYIGCTFSIISLAVAFLAFQFSRSVPCTVHASTFDLYII